MQIVALVFLVSLVFAVKAAPAEGNKREVNNYDGHAFAAAPTPAFVRRSDYASSFHITSTRGLPLRNPRPKLPPLLAEQDEEDNKVSILPFSTTKSPRHSILPFYPSSPTRNANSSSTFHSTETASHSPIKVKRALGERPLATVTLNTADFLAQPTSSANGTTADPEEAQEKEDLKAFVEQRRKALEKLRSAHRAYNNITASSTASNAVPSAGNSTVA